MKTIFVAVGVLAGFCLSLFVPAQSSNTGCTLADLERLERSRMPPDVREMMDAIDEDIKKTKEAQAVTVQGLPDLLKAQDPSK